MSPFDPRRMQVHVRAQPRPHDSERMRANARPVLAVGVFEDTVCSSVGRPVWSQVEQIHPYRVISG